MNGTIEEIAKRIDAAMRKAHLNPADASDFETFKGLLISTVDRAPATGLTLDLDKVAKQAVKARQLERAQAGELSTYEMAKLGYQQHYADEALKTSDGTEVSANALNLFKPNTPAAKKDDEPVSPYQLAKAGYEKHYEEEG